MSRRVEFFTDASGAWRASLRGPWSSDLVQRLRDENVSTLALIRTEGFRAENLDFLGELEFLTGLLVIDGMIRNVRGIEQLPQLEYLELRTYATTPLDFSSFPKLNWCHIDWIKGSESIFECPSIEHLGIWRFSATNLQEVGNLASLRSLQISQGTRLTSCDDIEGCRNLTEVHLGYLPNLRSFAALGLLKNLEVLMIETCRGVDDLEFVHPLTKLKKLVIGNCKEIRSLEPTRGLDQLERLEFWESTNVLDGDMSVLLELPRLNEARFRNRRHYSHTYEEVRTYLER